MDKETYLISKIHSAHIGDDGALIGNMVYTADAFCEGTHFLREWMSPYRIGRKAMLVNLSDAVAMNADPRYALVTISLPREMDREEIDEIVRGLEETATEYGCEIIGGDTVGGKSLHLSVTLISHSEAPLLRSGIRVGDLLAYTGELGGSLRDLRRLQAGERVGQDSRFFEPVLRGAFVREARPWLRAGMDISDGLYCDVNKLLDRNGLGLELFQSVSEEIGMSGEEYEMLLVFEPGYEERIRTLAVKEGTDITVIGRVEENSFRFPCRSHHFGE